MPRSAELRAVETYLSEVRRVRTTGAATAEQSFYPAVNRLLTELGILQDPKRRALSNPAAISGDFPDVAMYEEASIVVALPVEVKPASTPIATILGSAQAHRYARSFGGGRVMATNLRTFAVADLDTSGHLIAYDSVDLVPTEADLDRAATVTELLAGRFASMLDAGCSLRRTITDGRLVAKLLAYHAGKARDAVISAGNVSELLKPVSETMRLGLGMRVDEAFLVPTVIQTLTYGLFAAWLASDDPQDFDWMSAAYRLEIPVFADVTHSIMRPAFVRECDLSPHLAAAARTLTWVDRDAFVTQFEGGAIEYFYEPFLANFDSTLRDELGVWYTPREIATYQVSAVDHHLRADLGIELGLASDEVYVLDPAVGTGTYLTAVLQRIYQHHLTRGEPPAIAADRTRRAALERVVGFEILPAAFVICHLHLSKQLAELGSPIPPGDRLRVYLTNSLLGWGATPGQTELPIQDFERELQAAHAAKVTDPVLVILGNPPYHGYSKVEHPEEQALLSPWTEAARARWGLRKHRMGDLYVRFWRMAIQRIATMSGRGVVSFISNRKWLGGRSFPSMRETIAMTFDRVYIADLHGGTHDTSVAGDESIFSTTIATGIRVGTAIVTTVKTGAPITGPATLTARDFRGPAVTKRHDLQTLASADVEDGFRGRPLTERRRFRLTEDAGGDYPSLDEYFQKASSGVQPVRDEAVVDESRAALEARMRTYFNRAVTNADLRAMHPEFFVQRARYDAEGTRNRLLASSAYDDARIVRFYYRPFDIRWLYWEPEHKLLNEPRRELMPHWLALVDQRAIVATQTPRRPSAARPLSTTALPCWAAADPDARILPRLIVDRPEEGQQGGLFATPAGARAVKTNVAPEWITAARAVGITGSDDEVGDVVFWAPRRHALPSLA